MPWNLSLDNVKSKLQESLGFQENSWNLDFILTAVPTLQPVFMQGRMLRIIVVTGSESVLIPWLSSGGFTPCTCPGIPIYQARLTCQNYTRKCFQIYEPWQIMWFPHEVTKSRINRSNIWGRNPKIGGRDSEAWLDMMAKSIDKGWKSLTRYIYIYDSIYILIYMVHSMVYIWSVIYGSS